MRVLYISEIQWLSQISRKHQIVRRFPSDWNVVFVSPFNMCRRENSFRLRTDPSYPHVRFKSIPLPKPDSGIAPVRALTRPLLGLGGRHLLSLVGSLDPEVVVTSYIWAAPLARHLRETGPPVVYDCNDLHPEFYPFRRTQAEAMFRILVESATEVVCSSRRLRDVCGRGVVIGNGVDLSLFSGRRETPLPGPVADSRLADCDDYVVYVGSVDDRIDFEALESTVAALEGLDRRTGVLCVGRVFDGARGRAQELSSRYPRGILFTGRIPYDELPGYLSQASVGIAPFVLDERTRAINPNKLYMYAAMEQNVVSTLFSDEIGKHRDIVYLASDADEFARSVIDALGDDERRRAIRDRIALPHGWDERAQDFVSLMERVVTPGD